MKAGDMGLRDELSPIYHKRLQDDQFRLLYLPSVDDENHPIHASLETYQTDDCPEYETNCWSMLHYLRPRVSVRIIWVDAICINQMDHQERESQVAIMGNIYQQCLRAIVYLGQDVVRPRSGDTRKYPERRDLNMASASAMDLYQVFKMRYFQRVWVVQELILAPMAVIPVHGVELTAGRRTAAREGAWHESSAPWMSNICAGNSSDTSLGRILELTQNSQATDPREKVFGLLGFLSRSTGLGPNYLLSSLHVYVGAIAYMLLNEGHSHLLMEAPGYQPPHCPFMAPRWKFVQSWRASPKAHKHPLKVQLIVSPCIT
ncbi:hypothetical protein LCI18_003470 [Fusarium solani-melongenae]|uniref:Uncharacterized protein n=1 Tax=Fusarium solani subsp. cucurbitae TaxID=2747967 RepID=A0ACD3YUB5_FUSSC|nr:hypothetical protein LCI18_003470 [Fusarium solani-melongenae]